MKPARDPWLVEAEQYEAEAAKHPIKEHPSPAKWYDLDIGSSPHPRRYFLACYRCAPFQHSHIDKREQVLVVEELIPGAGFVSWECGRCGWRGIDWPGRKEPA